MEAFDKAKDLWKSALKEILDRDLEIFVSDVSSLDPSG